ncbi:MAG: carboxypeptidase regulatory-like domain-containing protein [Acidobacteriota bacterium]
MTVRTCPPVPSSPIRTLILVLVAAACSVAPAGAASARAEMRGSTLEAGTRQPLAGAVATLHSRAQDSHHYITSSDTEGRFLFHNLPRGTYDLEVTLLGYRTGRKNKLEIRPPFRSIIEVLLEPGSDPPPVGAPVRVAESRQRTSLQVLLNDRKQRPILEGLVSLEPLDGAGERRSGRTDPSGRIAFENQATGRYSLVASAPGFLSVRAEEISLGSEAPSRVAIILTHYPLDFAGNLEDLLPLEEPLLPQRLEIDTPQLDTDQPEPGRTP